MTYLNKDIADVDEVLAWIEELKPHIKSIAAVVAVDDDEEEAVVHDTMMWRIKSTYSATILGLLEALKFNILKNIYKGDS